MNHQGEVFVAVRESSGPSELSTALMVDGFEVTVDGAEELRNVLWAAEQDVLDPPSIVVADAAIAVPWVLESFERLREGGRSVFLLLIVDSQEEAAQAALAGVPFFFAPVDVDDLRTAVHNAAFFERRAEARSSAGGSPWLRHVASRLGV